MTPRPRRKPQLIVALDTRDLRQAEALVKSLRAVTKWFKVGSVLYTAHGRAAVDMVKAAGADVFLDLKWHDIPATVGKTVEAAASLGVGLATVHALGGRDMLNMAADASKNAGGDMKLLAVTVLTSMDRQTLNSLGIMRSVRREVIHLAGQALDAGIDGLVASPHEARDLRDIYKEQPLLVTPGIRPAGSNVGDQQRHATPADAVQAGADFLVVGRPITQAQSPVDAARTVLDEMAAA